MLGLREITYDNLIDCPISDLTNNVQFEFILGSLIDLALDPDPFEVP